MNVDIFNLITLFLISFMPVDNLELNSNIVDIPSINLIDNLVQNDLVFDVKRRGGFGGSKSYKSGFSKPYKKKSKIDLDLDDIVEDVLEENDDDEDFSLTFFLLCMFLIIIFYVIYSTRKK